MGDLVQFVRKTPEERRGISNGHKFREQRPEQIAADFYDACWAEAKDEAAKDPKNEDNKARLCVHTETLAMVFIEAGVTEYRERGNDMANKTADALEAIIEERFPNGSQLQRRLI